MSSSSGRCSACKALRRKCPQDCVLAPYFPSSNPHRFSCVHKIFGASNITKMLEQLPVHVRGEAAECMCFEAISRVRDPVYGCVGIISQLQQQIIQVQNEIVKTQGEVAYYNARQQQQQQQQQQPQILAQNQDPPPPPPPPHDDDQEEPFWFPSTQQDPLVYLDQQLFANTDEQQSPFE